MKCTFHRTWKKVHHVMVLRSKFLIMVIKMNFFHEKKHHFFHFLNIELKKNFFSWTSGYNTSFFYIFKSHFRLPCNTINHIFYKVLFYIFYHNYIPFMVILGLLFFTFYYHFIIIFYYFINIFTLLPYTIFNNINKIFFNNLSYFYIF